MIDIEKLTPENYIVPKGEERSYHCIIEVVQFDSKTGKKVSRPRIQKFGKKMFEAHIYSSLKKQGYSVTILHDPNDWIKKNEEEKAKKAKELAEAKAKAEKEAFEKAVQAEVARQLAAQNSEKRENKKKK